MAVKNLLESMIHDALRIELEFLNIYTYNRFSIQLKNISCLDHLRNVYKKMQAKMGNAELDGVFIVFNNSSFSQSQKIEGQKAILKYLSN